MKRICVFCGSASGKDEKYIKLAQKVGEMIAAKNCGLVYGGGKVGLMGTVANAVLAGKQEVIGVIPKNLVSNEVAHRDVTTLHIVEDMHERKEMMYNFSDAFLVLPGGMGTLDEMFEILTWAQLKLHSKPVYILNEFGFFDSLIAFIKHSNSQGFIRDEHLSLLTVLEKAEDLQSLNL
ncbi:MAG: LOG family protein [Pseudobdellovibrio sp.]